MLGVLAVVGASVWLERAVLSAEEQERRRSWLLHDLLNLADEQRVIAGLVDRHDAAGEHGWRLGDNRYTGGSDGVRDVVKLMLDIAVAAKCQKVPLGVS